MKFSQEFIERVAEANNIIDLISQHTQLKPTGGGLMGRCPFPDHQEKTPSFSVSETKQVYNCFGCHKSGNIFSFLRDFQGLSFPEAVEFLADRAGIALPKSENNNESVDLVALKRKQLIEVNRLAMSFFREQLVRAASDHVVRKYVAQRGLNRDTLETFQVGYAPIEWDGLVHFLQQKGVPMELAEEARLIKAKKEGRGYFDLFRHRLIFPILNHRGEPVGFGGRIIESGEPKYLNSPESMVFLKGKTLYGLFQTARYIRSEDSVLIVEGYMDLVSLYQAGVKNAVATMGTAMTYDHARLLRRITKNVVVLFDGDNAGQEAAERSLPLLLSSDIYPKGVVLPNQQDPDDFVKAAGADELIKRVSQAPDLFSLNLSEWLKNYRGEASEKVQIIDKLKDILKNVPDRRLLDLYIQESAQRLKMGYPWLKQALGPELGGRSQINEPTSDKNPSNNKGSAPYTLEKTSVAAANVETVPAQENQSGEVKVCLKGAPDAELKLMALLLKSRANFAAILEGNILETVTHEGVRNLLTKSADVYRQSPDKFDKLISHFMSIVDEPRYLFHEDPLLREMSREAGSEGRLVFDGEREQKLLRDTLKRVRENSMRVNLKRLAEEMRLNPTPEKMERLMNLQKNLSSLNKDI